MQPRPRIRSAVELAAVVSLPAAAAVALHRLGAHPRLQIDWSDLEVWLQVAPADDVAAALLRLVGLAAAYWIMATTALYVLARLTRVPAAIRAVEWATLPVARRAADRAVALALVGSSLGGHAGTALAAEVGQLPGAPPPPVAQLDADDADDGTPDLYEPTPAGDGQPDPGSPLPPRNLPQPNPLLGRHRPRPGPRPTTVRAPSGRSRPRPPRTQAPRTATTRALSLRRANNRTPPMRSSPATTSGRSPSSPSLRPGTARRLLPRPRATGGS